MSAIQIKQRPFITCPELFQDIPAFIAEILARRGVASTQELELKLKHLLPPSLKGLNEAIQLIIWQVEVTMTASAHNILSD